MLLGLDIGTTKVAAIVADLRGNVLAVASAKHRADLPGPADHAEQAPQVLLDAARHAVADLGDDLRREVHVVGLTGQMHGVLLLDTGGTPVSPLITWQDRRGLDDGFLDELRGRTGRPLSSGYGCATLAWLTAHDALPPTVASAATIQDFFVMQLCGQTRPITDPTDAASWGLFDLRPLAWDLGAVEAAGIDPALLPDVHPCGSRAGALSQPMAEALGLRPGIPVAVALGDNQASLLATLSEPTRQLALTIGTGAQASAVLPTGETFDEPAAGQAYELRPYPGERTMITAASPNGGAAWAWLARTAASWRRELDLPDESQDALYARLNTLGSAASDGPVVSAHFFGERHDRTLRGSVADVGPDVLSLGQLTRGLAWGIVSNLRNMLPPHALSGRTRLVGSGNALRRNPLLRAMAEEVFALPLVMPEASEEAALGAAINAAPLRQS
jgi:sedoheptulokinase